MKCSFLELSIIISLTLLCYLCYNQYNKIEYAKETIDIQHNAILKQQELIDHQKRYITFIQSQTFEYNLQPKQDSVFH